MKAEIKLPFNILQATKTDKILGECNVLTVCSLRFDIHNERLRMSMFRYALRKLFHSKRTLTFIGLVIISYALSTVSPYLNGLFIDFLITNQNIENVIVFALVIAVIGIAVTCLSYFVSMITVKISYNTAFLILEEVIGKLEYTELVLLEKLDASYTTQKVITDSNVIAKFIIGSFLAAPLNSIVALFICVLFFVVNQIIALFAVLLVVSYAFLFLKAKSPLYKASMEKKRADSRFFSVINSQIDRVFDTQLRSEQESSANFVKASFNEYFPAVLSSAKITNLFSSSDGIITAIFQGVLLLVAGVQIISSNMTVGEFIMINSYFAQLLNCTKYYVSFLQQYQDAKASYSRINEIECYSSRKEGDGTIDVIESIAIKQLSFDLLTSSGKKKIFNNLSLSFTSNTTYAVVGRNGCGKSTLLKLLTGLYDAEKMIFFNNTEMSTLSMHELRKQSLSVVPQKLYAPDTSVCNFAENYLHVTSPQLREMLSDPCAAFTYYSAQLVHLLDSNCLSLSGGELRKLYLWLAANKTHDVLILDEPNTGLDKAGKRELEDFIRNNSTSKIIIVMTHDEDLIKSARVVYDIEARNQTEA